MTSSPGHPSDAELLADVSDNALTFFWRHAVPVVGLAFRETRSASTSVEVAAETFAVALTGASHFRGPDSARGWLFAITRRKLAEPARPDAGRRGLGVVAPAVTDDGEASAELWTRFGATAAALVADLPRGERDAALVWAGCRVTGAGGAPAGAAPGSMPWSSELMTVLGALGDELAAACVQTRRAGVAHRVRRAVGLGAFTALFAVLLGAAALAKPNPAALKRDHAAIDLLNTVEKRIVAHDSACRYRAPDPQHRSVTNASPSAAMLRTFSIFRRPQATDETQLFKAIPTFGARGVYRRYARLAHTASGHTLEIVPARNVNLDRVPPRRCGRRLRSAYLKAIAARPRAFRSVARRTLRQVVKGERLARAHVRLGPLEGLFLFEHNATGGGGGGGGSTVANVRRHGMFFSSGGHGSEVSALIPDGVASIIATFPRTVSRGRYRAPKRFAHTVRRTVPVQENVISFPVPRPAPYAFPARMVWRAADGHVVRVVRD